MSGTESTATGAVSINPRRCAESLKMLGFILREEDETFIHHKTGEVLRSRDGKPVRADSEVVHLDSDRDRPHGYCVVPVLYEEATDKELEMWGFDDINEGNPAEWGNYDQAAWSQAKDYTEVRSRRY